MICQWESLPGDRIRCTVCGWTSLRPLPLTTRRRCGPVNAVPPAKFPSIVRQIWNLAESLAAFAADGCTTVTAEEYAARLAICEACEFRRETRCVRCGCGLTLKAQGKAFTCPENKWPNPN